MAGETVEGTGLTGSIDEFHAFGAACAVGDVVGTAGRAVDGAGLATAIGQGDAVQTHSSVVLRTKLEARGAGLAGVGAIGVVGVEAGVAGVAVVGLVAAGSAVGRAGLT